MNDTPAKQCDYPVWQTTSGLTTCPKCGCLYTPGSFHYCVTPPYQPWPQVQTRPYACPVCNGRGTVPAGFYSGVGSTNAMPETCQTCGGKGIVWG